MWIVPSNNPFCNNDTGQGSSIWYCDFTKNSVNYRLIWDNSNAGIHPNGYCSTFSNAYICGDKTYNVPSGLRGGTWSDMGASVVHPTGSMVKVGLNPILLAHPQ